MHSRVSMGCMTRLSCKSSLLIKRRGNITFLKSSIPFIWSGGIYEVREQSTVSYTHSQKEQIFPYVFENTRQRQNTTLMEPAIFVRWHAFSLINVFSSVTLSPVCVQLLRFCPNFFNVVSEMMNPSTVFQEECETCNTLVGTYVRMGDAFYVSEVERK
jgi:hypothetical protein